MFQASEYEIYFLDYLDSAAHTAIRKLTLTGVGTGTIETLAITQPVSGGPVIENSIVVVGGNVYTLDSYNNKIWLAPVAGGQRTAFATAGSVSDLIPVQHMVLAPTTSPDTFDLAFHNEVSTSSPKLYRVNQSGTVTQVFSYPSADNLFIVQLAQHPSLYPFLGASSLADDNYFLGTVDLVGSETTLAPSPQPWLFSGPGDHDNTPSRFTYYATANDYRITWVGALQEPSNTYAPVVIRYDHLGGALPTISLTPPAPIDPTTIDSLRYRPFSIVVF